MTHVVLLVDYFILAFKYCDSFRDLLGAGKLPPVYQAADLQNSGSVALLGLYMQRRIAQEMNASSSASYLLCIIEQTRWELEERVNGLAANIKCRDASWRKNDAVTRKILTHIFYES